MYYILPLLLSIFTVDKSITNLFITAQSYYKKEKCGKI